MFKLPTHFSYVCCDFRQLLVFFAFCQIPCEKYPIWKQISSITETLIILLLCFFLLEKVRSNDFCFFVDLLYFFRIRLSFLFCSFAWGFVIKSKKRFLIFIFVKRPKFAVTNEMEIFFNFSPSIKKFFRLHIVFLQLHISFNGTGSRSTDGLRCTLKRNRNWTNNGQFW